MRVREGVQQTAASVRHGVRAERLYQQQIRLMLHGHLGALRGGVHF